MGLRWSDQNRICNETAFPGLAVHLFMVIIILNKPKHSKGYVQNRMFQPMDFFKVLSLTHLTPIDTIQWHSDRVSFEQVCVNSWSRKLVNLSSHSLKKCLCHPQVVCVWEMKHSGPKERARTQLYLKDTLHGHTAPVTCLATSANYNLIVSGSKVSSLICHYLKEKNG